MRKRSLHGEKGKLTWQSVLVFNSLSMHWGIISVKVRVVERYMGVFSVLVDWRSVSLRGRHGCSVLTFSWIPGGDSFFPLSVAKRGKHPTLSSLVPRGVGGDSQERTGVRKGWRSRLDTSMTEGKQRGVKDIRCPTTYWGMSQVL